MKPKQKPQPKTDWWNNRFKMHCETFRVLELQDARTELMKCWKQHKKELKDERAKMFLALEGFDYGDYIIELDNGKVFDEKNFLKDLKEKVTK